MGTQKVLTSTLSGRTCRVTMTVDMRSERLDLEATRVGQSMKLANGFVGQEDSVLAGSGEFPVLDFPWVVDLGMPGCERHGLGGLHESREVL